MGRVHSTRAPPVLVPGPQLQRRCPLTPHLGFPAHCLHSPTLARFSTLSPVLGSRAARGWVMSPLDWEFWGP